MTAYFLNQLWHEPAVWLALGGILLYVLVWAALKVMVRVGTVGAAGVNIVHFAFLALAGELFKANLPPTWTRAVLAVQLALMAYLTVRIVVSLYIEQYLEQRRGLRVDHIIRDLIKMAILGVYALAFLRLVFEFNLATILTPSAILTAIIGLSMQDTISHVIAGIIIQIEKPFDLGDWIEIEDQKGQVREINWRYTKIETVEKRYIIIPNNKISKDKVINYSKPTPNVRQFLSLGVSYDVPPFRVKRAVADVLRAHPDIIEKEACEVNLESYGDSAINYQIVYIIRDTTLARKIRGEVFTAVWYQFKRLGIEIPYPIRTLIRHTPPPAPDVSRTVAVLAGLEFFEGISRAGLENLARFGLTHTVEPDHVIVREHEPGQSMFFILSGECRVRRGGAPVAALRAGDFFGEMCLLTDERRTAQVEAVTAGELLEVDRCAFKVLIESEPRMLQRIEAVFARRCAPAKDGATAAPAAPAAAQTTLFNRFKKLFGMG